ncbi:MAG: DUF3108 domain-containing protein [Bacteroidota bacterium]
MRRELIIGILAIVILSSFIQSDGKIENNAFFKGEYLEYKAYFGFIPVGHGSWKIHETNVNFHDNPSYKVDVFGKTSTWLSIVAPVDDHWMSLVDTSTLVTHMAYRNLIEGRYKKLDITEFFQEDSLIKVKDFDFDTKTFKEVQEYKMEGITRGMISGFMHMRTLDFDKVQINDTVVIKSFLDDTFYDLEIVCYKREPVETKAGTFKSVVFRPVMPDNSIFEGEDAILAWISDDENKIPLKVEAEMFIGHAGIELADYSGLRNKPALLDD